MALGKRPHEKASGSEALPPPKKAKGGGASGKPAGGRGEGGGGEGQRRPSWKPWKGGSGGRGGGGVAAKALSRDDRAGLRRERRASKPHQALIADANSLYRFDLRRMEADERRLKVTAILASTLSNIKELVVKHDTSRVYQLLCKHGSAEQRQSMADACRGAFLALSLDHYAHHFVLKLLQYSPPHTRVEVWKELRGHLADVAFHVDGGVVLDYLWAAEKSRRQQLCMLRELYHPTFALDAQTTDAPTAIDRREKGEPEDALASLCRQHPQLEGGLIAHTTALIDKALHKGVLQYRFIHCIAQQLLSLPSLSSTARAEVVSSLCASPSLPALLGSGDGVLALCSCVESGSAKERKAVLRCVKADPLYACRAVHGHTLLTHIVSIVDDTVAVHKAVWQPALRDPIAVAAFVDDVQGAKVLHAALTPPATPSSAAAAASPTASPPADGGEQAASPGGGVDGASKSSSSESPSTAGGGVVVVGSKKDRWVRYDEHLAFMLLPLLSVFTLDEHALLHPPALPAAVVAARAADRDEEELNTSAGPAAPQSLDSHLRSPQASAVLVDILHTAQQVLQRPAEALRSSALASQRPAIEDAIRIAVDSLAHCAAQLSEEHDSSKPHIRTEQAGGEQSESDEAKETASGRSSVALPSLPPLLQDRTAHYAFKRLLLPAVDKHSQQQPHSPLPSTASSPSLLCASLASSLLSALQSSPPLLRSTCASNRGCFVLLALVAALDEQQRATLRTAIRELHIDAQLLQLVSQASSQAAATPAPSADSAVQKKKRRAATADGDGERQAAGPVTGCRLLLEWLHVEQPAQRSDHYDTSSSPALSSPVSSSAASSAAAGQERSRPQSTVGERGQRQRKRGVDEQLQSATQREEQPNKAGDAARAAAAKRVTRAAATRARRGVEQ